MKIQAKGKTAEILLYEDIGGWFGITADLFAKEVKGLGDVSAITLRLNSNGGNVFDGLAIHNFLKSHKARVTVEIDGLAASIASIVAMAGDEIRMADNAWMMIHNPWIAMAGTASDLRDAADTMDGIRDSLLDTYMKRAQLKREEVSEMMDAETWLNAADAKKHGFVDSVTGAMKVAAAVRREWFCKVPEQLIAPPDDRWREKLARMDNYSRRVKLTTA